MIDAISKVIADWLLRENVVDSDNRELFSYAAYSLVFGLMPVVIVAILGLPSGMVCEGMLMVTPYMLIRKFSGGYHLNSARLCFVSSSVLLACALVITHHVTKISNIWFFTLITSISTITLCVFSPIDSEARRLTKKELTVFKTMSAIIALSTYFVYIVVTYIMSIRDAIPIGMGIIIAAFLQLPCLFGKVFKRK